MPKRDSNGLSGAAYSSKAGPRSQSTGTMEAVASLAILAVIACTLAADQAARPGHGYFSFMDLVAGLGAAALAFRALHRSRNAPRFASCQDIVESAGPMVMTIGFDGVITHVNPAAERLLGYFAGELVGKPRTADILAPGEGPRLIAELQRLTGVEPDPNLAPAELLNALMDTIHRMPPSQVPSFEGQFLRKDGTLLPVTLSISALRDEQAALKGLVIVALEQSGTLRQDQALRESQERYRDLFENSNEFIATLSTSGRFLYANPAWRRAFGVTHSELMSLDSFETLFEGDCRMEVATLFRRALDGEVIDRVTLRNLTAEGRVMEFELSLSQRQKAGSPLAIRCLLRDVTQQKLREHRLALQLVVSQIVGENSSPELAAMRIVEAVCVSQGWDTGIKWEVNADENRLEFSTAWSSPGPDADALVQESTGRSLAPGEDLPGRVWKEGRAHWIADLARAAKGPRIESALAHGMASGWAVPVRVGNRSLAVLEFYCRHRLREDPQA
ncbi:MAG: PAS domain S-box protein, partial [Terracidiphilus sp.]